MKKRVLSLIIAVTVVFALVACSGDNKNVVKSWTKETLLELSLDVPENWRKDTGSNRVYYYPTSNNSDGFLMIEAGAISGQMTSKRNLVAYHISNLRTVESFVEENSVEYDIEVAGYYAVRFDYTTISSNIEIKINSYYILSDKNIYRIAIAITMDSPDNMEDIFNSVIDSVAFGASIQASPSNPASGVAWREFLREYEDWVDSYIVLLEKYSDNPLDLTILNEYMEQMQRMIEWAEKAEEVEVDLANDPGALREYLSTLSRITTKLMSAVG